MEKVTHNFTQKIKKAVLFYVVVPVMAVEALEMTDKAVQGAMESIADYLYKEGAM